MPNDSNHQSQGTTKIASLPIKMARRKRAQMRGSIMKAPAFLLPTPPFLWDPRTLHAIRSKHAIGEQGDIGVAVARARALAFESLRVRPTRGRASRPRVLPGHRGKSQPPQLHGTLQVKVLPPLTTDSHLHRPHEQLPTTTTSTTKPRLTKKSFNHPRQD